MARSRDDRVVAGVAAGVAHRLGVDPVLVRIGFVVLAVSGGAGIVLYALLWAVTPSATEPAGVAATAGSRAPSLQQSMALVLITLGGLLLLRNLGLWLGDALVWPVVLVAAGSAIVWTRAGPDVRRRDASPPSTGTGSPGGLARLTAPASPLRIAVGSVLAVGGLAGFLAANITLGDVRDLALALVAATLGLGLLLAPWLWRLGDQLAVERRERIRQEERAELAAHLHDSVLQTLALIQRSSDDPRRMVTLARRQERELRGWLAGATEHDAPARLAAAVRALAEEVEAVHRLSIEVVVVGDAPLDDRLRALLAALREACVNAAKHAGVDTADVYVEVEDAHVAAFVRDRGRGFDPERVDPDRRGITDSIVGRMERHGGHAGVVSRPGEGTEVELALPRRSEPGHAPAPTEPGHAPAPTEPGHAPAPTEPGPPATDH